MGGMMGKSGSNASAAPQYTGVNIETSVYGAALTLAYGVSRFAGNLLWDNGFTATPVNTPASGGGKGGGGSGGGKGGKGGSGGTSYTYSANMIMGLCEGPINQVLTVWVAQALKTLAKLELVLHTGAFGQAVWPFLADNYPNQAYPYSGVANVAADPYHLGSSATLPNLNFEVCGFGSLRTWNEVDTIPSVSPYQILASKAQITGNATNALGQPKVYTTIYYVADLGVAYYPSGTPLTAVTVSPTAGQYMVDVTTGLYTFAAADDGKQVTLSYQFYGDADPSFVVTDLLTNANHGIGFPANRVGSVVSHSLPYTIPASGPYTVTPLGAANFLYNQCVTIAGVPLTCVAGAPAAGQYSFTSAGVYTFNAAQAGLSATFYYTVLGPLKQYQDFAMASGLWISPCYNSQTAANSMLGDIENYTYADFVWSSGVLTLVPRGTQPIIANGFTYTPNTTPLFALSDDDFVANSNPTGTSSSSSNDDPVILTRKRPSDQLNDIKLQCTDRSNQYASAVVEVTDLARIDKYGRRASPSNDANVFCDVNAANVSAQLLLQDQYIMNSYSFQTDQRYAVLDPMDLVILTDPVLFADLPNYQQVVRILSMTENDDGTLSWTAEEWPGVAGSAAKHTLNQGTGSAYDLSSDPGVVNAPIIFAPPPKLTGGLLEVYVGLSGPNISLWGGANVWASVNADGTNAKMLGQQVGPARMGVLTSDFPVGTDPDTADTLAIDLSQSGGALLSASDAAADQGLSVCAIVNADGAVEYIAYTTATLTGTNTYNLTGYIRRGLYGSAIIDHPSGSAFMVLDQLVYSIPYQPDQIGTALYLQFASFNILDGGTESLAECATYAITLPSLPPPLAVTDFTAQQNGGAVALGWTDAVDAAGSLKGYDILYGPQGGTIAGATLLTEASRTTETTTVSIPPGNQTVYIRARDITDQTGPAVSVNITVVNANTLIAAQFNEPSWLGPSISSFPLNTPTLPVVQSIAGIFNFATDRGSVQLAAVADSVTTAIEWLVHLDDGTENNLIGIYRDTSGNIWYEAVSGGVSQAAINLGTVANSAAFSVAFSWWPNGFAASLNGGAAASATGTVPSGLTTINVGQNSAALLPWRGALTRFRYFGIDMAPAMVVSASQYPNTEPWGFARHFTGILVPDTQSLASALTNAQLFENFVPLPVPAPTYIGPSIDTGFNSSMRVYFTVSASPGRGISGAADVTPYLDAWLTGQSDPESFMLIGPGNVTARYLRAELVEDSAVQSYLSILDLSADAPAIAYQISGFAVLAGGTLLTYAGQAAMPPLPARFHSPPNVQVTATTSGITGGGATSINDTSAEITLYTGVTSEPGNCNILITGV